MAQEINFEEFILSCEAEKERKYSDAQKSHTPPHDNDYEVEELLGEQSPIELPVQEPRYSADGLGVYDDPHDWNFDAESTQAIFYIGTRGEIINERTGATPRTESFASLTGVSEENSSVQLNIPPPSAENPYKKRKFVDIRELTCEDVRQGFSKSGNCEKGYHIKLSVANRGLKDLLSVSNFTQLTEIDVSGNYLKCVRGLGVMQYLEKLNASSNDIDTFIAICPIPLCLREVDFSKNCISKILNLKPFWTLTDINLSYNSLTKFEIEDPMYYLKSLDLSHNMIIRVSLNCPNLFILNLKSNCLNAIEGLELCSNLCSLNFARNQISELEPLKCFGNLVELHIERNNIDDLFEVEALKALLYLHCLWIHNNKISDLEYSRLMFIHTLPQLLSLDGEKVTIQEMRDAKNLFDPSFIKLSCLDHTNTLVDRACQPSNAMFNTYCHTTSAPPIILLVGTQPSTCHKLALLLKEEFRNSIHLGGVHSTAATLEGSNRDIPVSLEAFAEMKNRGDFLTTSHILGRICGFSSSQISRATERRAVLVASVPLGTAISIKKWKIQTKLVLVLSPIAQLTARIEQEKLLDKFRRMSEEEEPPPEEEASTEEELGDIMDDISVTEEQTDSIEDYDAADEQSEVIEEKFNSTQVDDIDAKLQIAYAEMDIMELYRYDDNPNRSWENRESTDDVPTYSPKEEHPFSQGENEEADENEYSDEAISDVIEDNEVVENENEISSPEEVEVEEDEGVESEELGEEDDDDIRSKKSSKDIQIVKKLSEQVKHDDSCRENTDIEYYNIKDADTLVDSIKKTREIYEEFHKENPEFLQEPLDAPDVCYSYALLLYELQNKLLLVLPPTSDLPLCSEVKKPQQRTLFDEEQGESRGEYDDDITSIEFQNWMAEHRSSSGGYRYSMDDRRKFTEMHRKSLGEHRASMGMHRTSKDWHRTSIEKEGNSPSEEGSATEEEENSTGEEETSVEEEKDSFDVRKFSSPELEHEKKQIKSNSLKIDHMDDQLEKLYAHLDTGELNKHEEHHLHGTHENHAKGEKKRDHRPSIDKEHLAMNNEHLSTGKERLSIDKEHPSMEKGLTSMNEHKKSDSQVNDAAKEMSDENRKSIDINDAELRPRKSIQWIDEIKDDKSEFSKSSSSVQSEIAQKPHVHERKDNTCREIHDIEYHKFKHKDALVESINKTTELYAEFNRENPGFFQQVLDASDLCNSFSRLRELALECIEAYQEKLKVPLTERKESSYAGHNTLDKAVFQEYKLKHYRNCSVAWSKGLDNFTKNAHSVPNSNDWCDLFWRKTRYPKNILDPTLPRQQHAKINRRGPMSKDSPCNNLNLK